MPVNRRSLIGKILICALAAWALAVIMPDFARIFTAYNKLGIEVDNDGRIVKLDDKDGARSQSNQRINTQCTALADRAAVLGGMGGRQYVRPDLSEVRLCVHDESSDPSTATVQSFPAKPVDLDLLTKFFLTLDQIFGVLFILGGVWLVWRRPTAMTWGFFLYAVWFNPGQYYVLYAELQRWPRIMLGQEFLQAVFQAAGYCGLILFALRFPNDRVDGRWRYLELMLTRIGIILAVLQLWSFSAIIGERTETVTRISYGAGIAVDVLVIAIVLIRRFTIDSAADRQRTRWVFWGCLVGLAGFLFADSNAATQMWDWMWTPSDATLYALYLTNAVLPTAVFYAIIRHRVVNVTFILSRKVVRPVLWFVIGIIVVQFHAQGEHLLHDFREHFAETGVLLNAIIALVAVSITVLLKWVIDRVHDGLCDAIEHLFFRSLGAAERGLRAAGIELSKETSHETINRRIAGDPAKILNIASAAVFWRDTGADSFRRAEGAVGWSQEHMRALPPGHPLAVEAKSRTHAAAFPLTWKPRNAKELPAGLAFPSQVFPIVVDNQLMALVLYGAHNDGDDLNPEEIRMLSAFINVAAAAHEHAELHELRARVEALEGRTIAGGTPLTAPS